MNWQNIKLIELARHERTVLVIISIILLYCETRIANILSIQNK